MACRSVQRRPANDKEHQWYQKTTRTDITIDNKKMEISRSLKCLGSIESDEGSKPEVLSRIAQTTAAVIQLKVIWNDKNIAISFKIRLMRYLAMSIFFVCM